jgi:epoxyqueuosine reductase QueG
MIDKKPENWASWTESVIEEFIQHSPLNTLQNPREDKAFENPLVGFSRGDDPIFETFKEHVGPFHWTPLEIFSLTFPETPVRSEDLTVISFILSQTRETKADNRKEKIYPADRWVRARIFGEDVNVKLRQTLVAAFQEKGISAVAPQLSPLWEQKRSDQFVFSSTWSERHAAHASGLGTFGVCDGLITPRGKAMRTGSVVAAVKIPPTPRPYSQHQAYCLFYSQGICGKCIKRCPAGALSEAGHDKLKCFRYISEKITPYVKSHYGFEGYGCGLCQTGVPCESRIPLKRNVES